MQNEADLDLDDALDEPQVPYLEILGTMALGFLHLGIAAVFGLVQFGPGARYWQLKGFWDPMVHFVFFAAILHFVVVLPFSTIARAQWEDLSSRALRVASAAFLLGLPLFSFGYYRGGMKVPMDFQELFLNAFLPATVAALFYERVRRGWILTLVLAPSAYAFLYVIGDFMTPMPVLFSTVPQGPSFYTLRALLPWTAVIVALWLNRGPRFSEVAPTEGARNFSFALLFVAAYGWLVQFAVPLAASRLDTQSGASYAMNWDLGFLVTLLASTFLLVRRPVALKILQGLSLAAIALWGARLVLFFMQGTSEFSDVTWGTTALLVLTAMGTLLVATRRPTLKHWFGA